MNASWGSVVVVFIWLSLSDSRSVWLSHSESSCFQCLAVGPYSTLRPSCVNTVEEMPCQNISNANHSAIRIFTSISLLPLCNVNHSKAQTDCVHNGPFIQTFLNTDDVKNLHTHTYMYMNYLKPPPAATGSYYRAVLILTASQRKVKGENESVPTLYFNYSIHIFKALS